MSQGEPVIDAARAAEQLGVEWPCEPDALRAAFRAAVKRAHPDRPGGDAAKLRAIIEAHELLRGQPPSVASPRNTAPLILEITPVEALRGLRRAVLCDGALREMRLPAGLRAGDRVRLGGALRTVTITSQDGLAVIGDHLCVSVEVEPQWLRQGGALEVTTPLGSRQLRITRQDAVRGLSRIVGAGLPARGDRMQGDLLVWLKPMAAVEPAQTPAQTKLRRFAAAWAA